MPSDKTQAGSGKTQAGSSKMDRIVAEARRNREQRPDRFHRVNKHPKQDVKR